jgi:hypothetical protein
MATACRHGDGTVVLTRDGTLVYLLSGIIVSSDRALSLGERKALEIELWSHPPKGGVLTTQQVRASLRVSYDEEDHADDRSLGSDDTWSDEDEDED